MAIGKNIGIICPPQWLHKIIVNSPHF